eukprot:INCI9597.3.p1 GENE.INCI9597.3~~INCI9597.3.p1  ORF type:complete len:140 (-),score=2.65 INCI9597.3:475-894(-)
MYVCCMYVCNACCTGSFVCQRWQSKSPLLTRLKTCFASGILPCTYLLTGHNPVSHCLEKIKSTWPQRRNERRAAILEWAESFHDDEGRMRDLGGCAHEDWTTSCHAEWESWWTNASLAARTAQQLAFVQDAKAWILASL